MKEWSALRTVKASGVDEMSIISSITVDEDGKMESVLGWRATIRYDDGHVALVDGPLGDMVKPAMRQLLIDVAVQVHSVINGELFE